MADGLSKYTFDPELLPILHMTPERAGAESIFSDVSSLRATMQAGTELLKTQVSLAGVNTRDLTVPGVDSNAIPIRIYTPRGGAGNCPVVISLHGGGLVVGDIDSMRAIDVPICEELGFVVVSVAYRLAPEHPYPAPLDDCYSVLGWVHSQANSLGIDRERIAVMGLSGGGCLAAALALKTRDEDGPPLCFQYLCIPELDDRCDTHSMHQLADAPGLRPLDVELAWSHYLGDQYQRGADDVPYLASPARAQDLQGLPPAFISALEYDPLRDEGIHYAMALMRAGVPVELHVIPGLTHGVNVMPGPGYATRYLGNMRDVLRRALAATSR